MKVRIIKDHLQYRRNQVIEVTKNVGFGLIDAGVAIVDKMMSEYRTSSRRRRSQNNQTGDK